MIRRLRLLIAISGLSGATACATAPAPVTSSLTAPRCVPSCPVGQHCVQLNNEPGRPPLPPYCAPN